MSQTGSITGWLEGLRAGEEAAAQRLWEVYFHRLVGMARARLAGRSAGPAGSDDIALSAFASFCRGAEAGRFPRLNDSNDLWQVLMMLTARKVIDAVRREHAIKHGGGLMAADGPHFETIVGDEPTPSFAAGRRATEAPWEAVVQPLPLMVFQRGLALRRPIPDRDRRPRPPGRRRKPTSS